MTVEEAVSAAYEGRPVDCEAEQWPQVRRALQDAAARWIESGQDIRAMVALQEVRRLDARFDASYDG